MPSESWLEVGKLVAGTAGALLGALVGARLGVAKLKRERAFERQLQWHEDIADNLYRLADSLNTAATKERNARDKEAILDAWKKVMPEVERLAVLGQKAEMYASHLSLTAIRDVMTQMKNAVVELKQAAGANGPTDAELTRVLSDLVPPVRQAATAVADDVRRQLGLAPRKPRRALANVRTWLRPRAG